MSLHNRWGEPVAIIANAGECKPWYFDFPWHLVKVRYEDGEERWTWAETLRAAEGAREVFGAVDAAPAVKLSEPELKAAYQEAE